MKENPPQNNAEKRHRLYSEALAAYHGGQVGYASILFSRLNKLIEQEGGSLSKEEQTLIKNIQEDIEINRKKS